MENNLNEILAILQSSKIEINSLRKRNEILSAKVEIFDSIMLVLKTQPNYNSVGMSLDITYEIDKLLKENGFF